ncbi:MAG: YjdF family protein [Sporolactobacillus sp.]
MKLTVYYDGQFYVGLIEVVSDSNKLQAYRYVFGAEPKNQEIFAFICRRLLPFIESRQQNGLPCHAQRHKPSNPKRLQREAAKEMQRPRLSSKAQDALKAAYEQQKQEKRARSRQQKDEKKAYIRSVKVQKAKNKHRGR